MKKYVLRAIALRRTIIYTITGEGGEMNVT